jgi:excisionase family DNA binding protein
MTKLTLAGFYTVLQIAELLGVSTRSVYRWIAEGKLIVHRFGRSLRVSEPNLRAFIDAHYQ